MWEEKRARRVRKLNLVREYFWSTVRAQITTLVRVPHPGQHFQFTRLDFFPVGIACKDMHIHVDVVDTTIGGVWA